SDGKEGVDGSSPSEGFRIFPLSSSFRCPSGRRLTLPTSTQRPTAWTSTLSASDSARHDLDRGMDVVCFPRLDIPREGGAVVPLADAVQQVDLDLRGPCFTPRHGPWGSRGRRSQPTATVSA